MAVEREKKGFFARNKILIIILALIAIILIWVSIISNNIYSATINSIRVWRAPDNTRIVFDLDANVKFDSFTLSSPERLVIDLENSLLKMLIRFILRMQ